MFSIQTRFLKSLLAGIILLPLFPARAEAEQSIYVTDRYFESSSEPNGPRIIEIQPASGQRRVASGPVMFGPQFVARDPRSGDLFVTDLGLFASSQEAVWRFNPFTDGALPVSGLGVGTGPDWASPAGLAFESGGTIVVIDPDANRLVRVDPFTGARAIVSGDGIGSGETFFTPFDIAAASDGWLIVTEGFGKVVRVDPATGNRIIVSSSTVGAGLELQSPIGLAIEPSGTIVVVDGGLYAVVRIDRPTGNRTVLSSNSNPPYSGPQFIEPYDILVEPGGTFLVTDLGQNAVLRVDANGDRTIVSGNPGFGTFGAGPALESPRGIALLDGATAIVVDEFLNALVAIDLASGDRTILPSSRRGGGPELDEPIGLTLLDSANLAVADSGLDAILRVELATGQRTLISSSAVGSGPSFSTSFEGLAKEAGGNLVVCQPLGDSVMRVEPGSGNRSIVSSSTVGSGTGLSGPSGIAVEAGGALVVADSVRDAVLRIDPLNGNRSVLDGAGISFFTPYGIAIETSGRLVVTDSYRRAVFGVEPITGVGSTISGDPNGLNRGSGTQFQLPTGIAVEATGDLLAVDQGRDTLMRINIQTGDRVILSGYDPAAAQLRGVGPYLRTPEFVALGPPLPALTSPPSPTPPPSQSPSPTASKTPSLTVSSTMSLTPTVTPLPPVIVRQPIGQAANVGQNIALVVEAVGEPPLSYQWFKGTTAMAGMTEPTLLLAAVTSSNLGVYHCDVANPWGVMPSENATLAVFDPPSVNAAAFVEHTVPATMFPGQELWVGFAFKNTSALSWSAAQNYELAVIADGSNLFQGISRLTPADPAAIVDPGEIGQFIGLIQAPTAFGGYTVQLKMVEEFVEFFGAVAVAQVQVVVRPNEVEDWARYE